MIKNTIFLTVKYIIGAGLLAMVLQCGLVVQLVNEPVKEYQFQKDASRMERGLAAQFMQIALFNYNNRCGSIGPFFLLNKTLNNSCSNGLIWTEEMDGCARHKYIPTQDVLGCTLGIESSPCAFNEVVLAAVMALCNAAFKPLDYRMYTPAGM